MRRFLIPAAAVVAVMLLTASATVALMSARANANEVVPVALVNLDEPVTVEDGEEEQTIAAGRLLAAEITTGSESELAWTLIDGGAIDVNETEFYAVVTIPEDFSAVISAISDGNTQPATITLETDEPASPIAARVAEQVADAATEAFNADFTSTYLENVYLSYNGIKEAVGEAATGSFELESSTQQLSDGATDLANGATELANGTASAATASQSLSSGATATADGATDVADGATTLAAALESVASTTSETLVPLTSSSAEQSANLAQTLTGLAQNCPPSVGGAYCASVAEAAQASIATAETSRAADATATGISSGIDDASQASDNLAAGTSSVSQGAADTAEGSTSLASALGDLADGAETLAQSSGELALAAYDIAEGATSLTDGLREIEESVPFYEEDVQVELADTVASPATITRTEEDFNGAARFVAIAAALALWFGAAVTYLRRPAVPRWALSGGLASRAVATGLVPRLAVAAIGSISLWGLIVAMGASGPNPVALLTALLASAICLTAVLHAIFTVAGRAGHVVVALFGLLQLTAAGLYAPIETTAPTLQSLSKVMPLSLAAQLIRDVVFARPVEPLGVLATFVAWFLLAVTASIAITRSRASNEYRKAG